MSCARRLIFFCCLTLGLSVCLNLSAEEKSKEVTPEQTEFFEKKIRPVFANNCFKCHGPEKQEANLRLDKYATMLKGGDTGPAVVPGDTEKSEVVGAIGYDPTGYQMPPDGKLPQEDIDNIIAWIKMGAPWPGAENEAAGDGPPEEFNIAERLQHWSYQPVRDFDPPEVSQADWIKTPVDAFILQKLEAAGMKPEGPADKRTLLRRITFDLTGLPPTQAEIDEFLADGSPQAYEKVVNRLLDSPAYGERWARHWLDLVRYAETAGHEFDYDIPYAWRYRDYVIRALNDDLPYDQFLVEHLAGDLLENPRRHPQTGENESILATGFYWFPQGKHSPVDIRAEECDVVNNQIDVIGRAFLASSIACARCHDHKFDPISTQDYYALAGFLQSSRRDQAMTNPPQQMEQLAGQIRRTQSGLEPQLKQTARKSLGPALQSLQEQLLKASAAWLTNPEAEGWPKYLTHVAQKSEHHPLFLWSQLGHLTDAEQFRTRKAHFQRHWAARLNASQQMPEGTVIFEDFSTGEFTDWFSTGPAFQDAVTRQDRLTIGNQKLPIEHVWQAGTLNSGLAGGKWQGFFRSPTFEITHDTIWYRVKRIGGKPAPGRKHKNGQISLIVDGFQFIQEPLYGNLTQNVPNDGHWHWIRQDVRKFPGHRAYIELADEDEGTLVVDEILFSNQGPPPDAPDALQLALVDDETIDTPRKLADAYQKQFQAALTHWEQQDLKDSSRENSEIQWVNWLVDSPLIEKTSWIAARPNTPLNAEVQRLHKLMIEVPAPSYALAITDGTPEDEHILIRGQHTKPGQFVPRRFLQAFDPGEVSLAEDSSGRLELARKFASPDNPLTARVLVNRLWHHHFGKGIVASVDDFGYMGKPPTNPELLDWLAGEFIDHGWSLKHMHRLMVLSNTYRMSSDITAPAAEQADPENNLLHRMNLIRLEGEAIRDAMLQISGRLDGTMYGPSVMPYVTDDMEARGRPQSGPLDGNGRRSIYINVRRNFLTPMFLAFDFPTPFSTMGRRSVSNVPAQALILMNNEFVIQQAKRWSEHVLQRVPAGTENALQIRINTLYESALARKPTEAETAAARDFIAAQSQEYGADDNHPQALADLCQVMFNVKEFYYVR